MTPPEAGSTTAAEQSNAQQEKAPSKDQGNRERAIALMRRKAGASIADITAATGWQPHSARAVISGLRKAGYTITRTREGGASRYRIAGSPA